MPVLDTALEEATRILRGEDACEARGISDHEISKLAGDACQAYISGGVLLNDSITKIARARGLAPNFIDRLVEAANVETYHAMLKRAAPEDRAHIRFPLAKKASIAAAVVDPGPAMAVKVASAGDESHLDFMAPPPGELCLGVDYGAGLDKMAMQVFEVSNQVEHGLPPHPRFARLMFQKLATAEQELQGEIIGLRIDREVAARRFVKQAKSLMLSGDGDQVREIYRDAVHLGLRKLAEDLLGEAVAEIAHAAPHMKLAAPVEPEYLPDNFPGRVINGEQIVLKLLRDVSGLDDQCSKALRGIDDLDNTRERMTVRVLDLSS